MAPPKKEFKPDLRMPATKEEANAELQKIVPAKEAAASLNLDELSRMMLMDSLERAEQLLSRFGEKPGKYYDLELKLVLDNIRAFEPGARDRPIATIALRGKILEDINSSSSGQITVEMLDYLLNHFDGKIKDMALQAIVVNTKRHPARLEGAQGFIDEWLAAHPTEQKRVSAVLAYLPAPKQEEPEAAMDAAVANAEKLASLVLSDELGAFAPAFRALSAVAGRKDAAEKAMPILLKGWRGPKEAPADRAGKLIQKFSERNPEILLPYAAELSNIAMTSLGRCEISCIMLERLVIAEPENAEVRGHLGKLLEHSLSAEKNDHYHFFSAKILGPLLRASKSDKRLDSLLKELASKLHESLERHVTEKDYAKSKRELDAFSYYAQARKDLIPGPGVPGRKSFEVLAKVAQTYSDDAKLAMHAIAEPEDSEVRGHLGMLLEKALSANEAYAYHDFSTKILGPLLRASKSDKRLDGLLKEFASKLHESLEKHVAEKDAKCIRELGAFSIYAQARKDLIPDGIEKLAKEALTHPEGDVRTAARTLLNAIKE